MNPEIITIVCMIAVFIAVICGFIIQHYLYATRKKMRNTWLFSNWQEAIYDVVFKDKEPLIIAKRFGIDALKYTQNCKLCRETPKLKKVIIERILGILILLASTIGCLITASLIVLCIGYVVSVPFMFYSTYFAKSKVEKRKFQISEELPRFMDLLHTALIIDVPTIQALKVTAEHLPDMILSQELKLALADTQMGIVSWQSALEGIANDYQVEVLSEFAMELINAYNNGVSVADAVKRKSKDVKQTNVFNLKERAKKMTSTILFPIMIFKILPIMAILCIPVIQQLNSSSFGM